ncbi:MAG: diphthine--ammonia ligase [Nitrososphaerota archaeon]
MYKEKVVMSWSGGKDSSLALHALLGSMKYDVKLLLTTVTKDYGRISMHGVREELLRKQSQALGIPLDIAYISKNANNSEYESKMREKVEAYKSMNIRKVAFGDIFLQDVREYRESRMSKAGMECLFPIWGANTKELAKEFIRLGFKAILCTVDPRVLSKDFAGREFSEDLLEKLPDTVDPCGEKGEFHTFVYDGPDFQEPIRVRVGEIVLRDNFYFADIVPV